MQTVIAAHAIAVPRSGWNTMSPRKTRVGMTAGNNVFRQSSIDLPRPSRKYARKKIIAGFATSEGWKEKAPQWIQRCVLCARSRKKTEINISVVKPKRENTNAGLLKRR